MSDDYGTILLPGREKYIDNLQSLQNKRVRPIMMSDDYGQAITYQYGNSMAGICIN